MRKLILGAVLASAGLHALTAQAESLAPADIKARQQ